LPNPLPQELAPTCAEGGIIGAVAGIIGTIMACEIIKNIVGIGEDLTGRLLILDGLNMKFSEIKIPKDTACAVCGNEPTIKELIDYNQFCNGRDDFEIEEITPKKLQEKISRNEPVQIIDIRDAAQRALFKIDGAKIISPNDLKTLWHEIDPNVCAVFVCQVGKQSNFAIKQILRAGFKGHALNLKGGSDAWRKEFYRNLR
jgi:adenylyltransferase/sulfurtransferase